jgi:hypothetical protein
MPGAMMGQPQGIAETEPTHVVGGQGRRGILPSAPGRAPIGQGVDGKGPYQFEKTADGKFQCPHCPKTYLHQKHLKRHMLRRKFWLLPKLLGAIRGLTCFQTRAIAPIDAFFVMTLSVGAIF